MYIYIYIYIYIFIYNIRTLVNGSLAENFLRMVPNLSYLLFNNKPCRYLFSNSVFDVLKNKSIFVLKFSCFLKNDWMKCFLEKLLKQICRDFTENDNSSYSLIRKKNILKILVSFFPMFRNLA